MGNAGRVTHDRSDSAGNRMAHLGIMATPSYSLGEIATFGPSAGYVT